MALLFQYTRTLTTSIESGHTNRLSGGYFCKLLVSKIGRLNAKLKYVLGILAGQVLI